MDGSVSGVCQQICSDVLWGVHFLLSLSTLCSLFFRAMATDKYHQFKLGHSTQCLHATRSAASTTTAQLNFSVAKQQHTTEDVWKYSYVLHESRISERSWKRCTLPFISLKGTQLSEDKINTFYLAIHHGYTQTHIKTHEHIHSRTHPKTHCSFFVYYITVSGSYFSSEN